MSAPNYFGYTETDEQVRARVERMRALNEQYELCNSIVSEVAPILEGVMIAIAISELAVELFGHDADFLPDGTPAWLAEAEGSKTGYDQLDDIGFGDFGPM